jgi:uncharacterized protein (TIGR02145 family)
MKKNILFVAAILLQLNVNAQTSVNGAGGEATGSNGQMSFSVGEIVYTTMSNASYSVAQGIQQPYIPPFNYTISSSNNAICSGTTVTLSVNLPGSYPAGTVHCSGTPTVVVDVTSPVTGKIWMDRNLGASQVATSSTDAAAYGDLYQWGRAADGHQCRNSATTTVMSSTDQPGHGNFIFVSTSPNDWKSPQNNNLWQGVNGVNNPCPSGYRIPTETELNDERLSWSQNNNVGAFSSPLKFSLAGYRDGNSSALHNLGGLGLYWTNSINSSNSKYLRIELNNANISIYYRVDGYSVRCIKQN